MQAARKRFLISTAVVVLIILVPTAALATTILHLLPGTAVLLSKTGHGALSSTSSRTNTFSPAAFVDYKRFGGEPTVTVDRYPFPGTNTSQA
ncbi:MAG TPA: hypothetical protein VHV50_13095, partial [Actinomycetota bacterium]|nr:hypothetical protein [Actinomycetota bacterium]